MPNSIGGLSETNLNSREAWTEKNVFQLKERLTKSFKTSTIKINLPNLLIRRQQQKKKKSFIKKIQMCLKIQF